MLYSYQAADDTEVTVTEGDVVTFVPRDDVSAGWMMVRVEGGAQGWVPESYLQLLAEEGVATERNEAIESEKEGVSKETGQVMPQEPASPAQSSCEWLGRSLDLM